MCERFSYKGDQLTTVSTISERQPEAAYLAFVSGFESKRDGFLRTIPNIFRLLLPLEKTIRDKFISTSIGGHICNDKETLLISLPTTYGGLDIPIFYETSEIEF